jgi:hypothetical protein
MRKGLTKHMWERIEHMRFGRILYISHFKSCFQSPFLACTRQPHENNDAIYAWKNIELWTGQTGHKWISPVEEVNVLRLQFLPAQLHTSHSFLTWMDNTYFISWCRAMVLPTKLRCCITSYFTKWIKWKFCLNDLTNFNLEGGNPLSTMIPLKYSETYCDYVPVLSG